MTEPSVYEKQLMWKIASNRKAEKLREQTNVSSEPTFQPTMYSSKTSGNVEGQTGKTVSKNYQKQTHRQHKRHRDRNNVSVMTGGLSSQHTSFVQNNHSDTDDFVHNDDAFHSDMAGGYLNAHYEHHNTSNDVSSEQDGENDLDSRSGDEDNDDMSAGDSDDSDQSEGEGEPIVEMLERERREWRSEREKLIQCIHLQQLELTQRAVAAHERSMDIAREFARAIEGFEERLVGVETSVQREISSLRGVADMILAAANAISGRNNNSNSSNVAGRGQMEPASGTAGGGSGDMSPTQPAAMTPQPQPPSSQQH